KAWRPASPSWRHGLAPSPRWSATPPSWSIRWTWTILPLASPAPSTTSRCVSDWWPPAGSGCTASRGPRWPTACWPCIAPRWPRSARDRRPGRGARVITVLAGGVGAARFLSGLVQIVDPTSITAIVNTGDDTVLHGLTICPDLDTVTYTLAGAIDP